LRLHRTNWHGIAAAALLGLAGGSAQFHPARADERGTLVVRIADVRSAKGLVHVDICTAASFLKSCAYMGSAAAVPGVTSVTIRDLPPGRYAAQVYHDANGNGKVDRKLFGIPAEGVGFSNDAPIRLGPPKFADAAFDMRGGAQSIALKLRYF